MMTQRLPEWDLTSLYGSVENPKIEADLARLETDVPAFQTRYQGRLSTLDAAAFKMCLEQYEQIEILFRKLYCFASLIYHQEMQEEWRVSFYQKTKERLNDLSQGLIFFTLELNGLDEAVLESVFEEDSSLSHYRPWLRDLRAFKPYQLSEKEEVLAHNLRPFSSGNWVRLHNESFATLRFSYLDKKDVTLSDVMNDFSSPDPTVRREANLAFGETVQSILPMNALALNTIVKEKAVKDKMRGFKRPISSRNLDNLVDDEVVDALMMSVKDSYGDLAHRYYRLKARIMGQKQLAFWDRNAPLSFGETPTYGWEESCRLVQTAYAEFSPEIGDIVQQFYDKSWIDAALRPGKDSGAFSMGTVPEANPFILVNFHGKMRDVTTLAHELGHGVHQYLSAGQGVLMMDTPLTVAETASVFGEMLTFKSLYKSLTTANEKKALLASKIEDMLNTVVRQVAFADFETQVHALRQERELTLEDFQRIWVSVQQASLGEAIHVDVPEYANYWSYVSHFYHTPFYVYAYAFGDCLVNALYTTYESGFPGFQGKYIDLLKAGGSKRYDDLLKPFDLDAKDPAFWKKGLKVIQDMIDDFEKLVLADG